MVSKLAMLRIATYRTHASSLRNFTHSFYGLNAGSPQSIRLRLTIPIIVMFKRYAPQSAKPIVSDYPTKYHLPKKSENFDWNVNGKTNLVFPNGKFPEKMGFSPKFPNEIFKWKMWVPFALCY